MRHTRSFIHFISSAEKRASAAERRAFFPAINLLVFRLSEATGDAVIIVIRSRSIVSPEKALASIPWFALTAAAHFSRAAEPRSLLASRSGLFIFPIHFQYHPKVGVLHSFRISCNHLLSTLRHGFSSRIHRRATSKFSVPFVIIRSMLSDLDIRLLR